MPTIRIKPIVDTLDVVKKNGLYYRVIPKGDSFSTSRVKLIHVKMYLKNHQKLYTHQLLILQDYMKILFLS